MGLEGLFGAGHFYKVVLGRMLTLRGAVPALWADWSLLFPQSLFMSRPCSSASWVSSPFTWAQWLLLLCTTLGESRGYKRTAFLFSSIRDTTLCRKFGMKGWQASKQSSWRSPWRLSRLLLTISQKILLLLWGPWEGWTSKGLPTRSCAPALCFLV